MAMKFDKKAIRNTETCKKQANFNQNKTQNKQPASLKKKHKKTSPKTSNPQVFKKTHKKQAQIRGKNARLATLYCNLKLTFEDLLPCYCYAIKTKSTTIRQQVSQPASAGKGSDQNRRQKVVNKGALPSCRGLDIQILQKLN